MEKSITERAKEYANNRESVTNPSVLCYMAEAYEDGAKEQKAIDDDHLREVKKMVIEKACDAYCITCCEYCSNSNGKCLSYREFKKALEE